MQQILFYERPYYFCSNFSSFSVRFRGREWTTAEHAYQAAKFDDFILQEMIRKTRSAHEAYKLAQKHRDKTRSDWSLIKLAVMEEILRAKLEQHPYIKKKLIESGDAELVEDSPEDGFWGRGPDWKGENHLGRIWIKLRDEIRSKPPE